MLVISKTEYPERLAEKDKMLTLGVVRDSCYSAHCASLMCENRWSSKMWALKTVTWSNEHVHLPSCTFIHHCTLNICSEQFPCLLLWTDPRWNCNEVSDSCGTFIDQFSWRSFKLLWDSISEMSTTTATTISNESNVIQIMHCRVKIHCHFAYILCFFIAPLHRLDLESSGPSKFYLRTWWTFSNFQVNSYLRVLRRMPLWCEDFQDDFEWFRCRFTVHVSEFR